MKNTSVLTLSCPDKPGIVHAVSGLLLQHGANIEEAAQHSDAQTGLFFMRVQFTADESKHADIDTALNQLAAQWQMVVKLHTTALRMRIPVSICSGIEALIGGS